MVNTTTAKSSSVIIIIIIQNNNKDISMAYYLQPTPTNSAQYKRMQTNIYIYILVCILSSSSFLSDFVQYIYIYIYIQWTKSERKEEESFRPPDF